MRAKAWRDMRATGTSARRARSRPVGESGHPCLGRSSLRQVSRLASSSFCGPLGSLKTIELFLRPRKALVRCSTIPPDGFHAIQLHPATVLVRPAEVGLPKGGSLFGRAAKPPDGFTVVLRHSAAVQVHGTEVVLPLSSLWRKSRIRLGPGAIEPVH